MISVLTPTVATQHVENLNSMIGIGLKIGIQRLTHDQALSKVRKPIDSGAGISCNSKIFIGNRRK